MGFIDKQVQKNIDKAYGAGVVTVDNIKNNDYTNEQLYEIAKNKPQPQPHNKWIALGIGVLILVLLTLVAKKKKWLKF